MPLMDEFKEERDEIKNAPFKKKWDYFWEYYKWWAIGGILALIAIAMFVRSILTRKEEVLYVALINAAEVLGGDVDSNLNEPFLTAHDYDPKKYKVSFDADFKMNISGAAHAESASVTSAYIDYVSTTASASSQQTLSVYVAAKSVDLLAGSENWFDEYAYNGFYLPLADIFTEEELEKYSDCLYYIDYAVKDRYNEATQNQDYKYSEKYPDPYDIEAMENPVAVGIILKENTIINTCYAFVTEDKGDNVVIGIISNSKRPELSHDLIISLLEEVEIPEQADNAQTDNNPTENNQTDSNQAESNQAE